KRIAPGTQVAGLYRKLCTLCIDNFNTDRFTRNAGTTDGSNPVALGNSHANSFSLRTYRHVLCSCWHIVASTLRIHQCSLALIVGPGVTGISTHKSECIAVFRQSTIIHTWTPHIC